MSRILSAARQKPVVVVLPPERRNQPLPEGFVFKERNLAQRKFLDEGLAKALEEEVEIDKPFLEALEAKLKQTFTHRPVRKRAVMVYCRQRAHSLELEEAMA